MNLTTYTLSGLHFVNFFVYLYVYQTFRTTEKSFEVIQKFCNKKIVLFGCKKKHFLHI